MRKSILFLPLLLLLGLSGCRWLEVNPEQFILAEDALETPEDLQALLVSCYDVLANLYDGDVQLINELRGDNTNEPRSNNDLRAVHNRETIRWTTYTGGVNRDFFYPVLRANSLLESFDYVEGLSSEERTRMEAEAKFIRAFCFWGAVKMFAQPYGYTAYNSHLGIPLPTYLRDTPFPRATVGEAYAQIEQDLNEAIESLPESNGRYATKDAAKGLLAQVHFLKLEFSKASQLATEVIESLNNYQLEDGMGVNVIDSILVDSMWVDTLITEVVFVDSLFLRLRLPIGTMSPETVFGTYSKLEINDNRADQFAQWWTPTSNPEITLTSEFWDWFNYTAGAPEDRRAAWFEPQPTEGRTLLKRFAEHNFFNVPLIHLTQLMLIRAECFGELNTNLDVAIADINAIRQRAGITTASAFLEAGASSEDVIEAARDEFRKETIGMGLWVEQLQRRGTMGEDISIRNAPWDCPGMALQFSASEGNVSGFQFNEVGGCN